MAKRLSERQTRANLAERRAGWMRSAVQASCRTLMAPAFDDPIFREQYDRTFDLLRTIGTASPESAESVAELVRLLHCSVTPADWVPAERLLAYVLAVYLNRQAGLTEAEASETARAIEPEWWRISTTTNPARVAADGGIWMPAGATRQQLAELVRFADDMLIEQPKIGRPSRPDLVEDAEDFHAQVRKADAELDRQYGKRTDAARAELMDCSEKTFGRYKRRYGLPPR